MTVRDGGTYMHSTLPIVSALDDFGSSEKTNSRFFDPAKNYTSSDLSVSG